VCTYKKRVGILFFSAALALPACQQSEQPTVQEAAKPLLDPLGVEWKGRDGQRWNVTAIRKANSNEFNLLRQDRTDPQQTTQGKLLVDVYNDKLKVTKVIAGITFQCDGLLSSDHRFISGVCFRTIGEEQVVVPDHDWWVTIRHGLQQSGSAAKGDAPSPPKLNINFATVDELERQLQLDPEQARAVIEYKLNAGRIASIDDLHRSGTLPAKVVKDLQTKVSFQ